MKASKAFPGQLSPELKEALGMSELTPPPWLINMQRYGPPPSYPSLKVPGLNAPIPPGTEFGYHPGGWGKPPVDASGQPLYGDVFGVHVEPDDDIDLEARCLFASAPNGCLSHHVCSWKPCSRLSNMPKSVKAVPEVLASQAACQPHNCAIDALWLGTLPDPC
jgi:PSP